MAEYGLRRYNRSLFDQGDYASKVAEVEQQAAEQSARERAALTEPGKAFRQGVLGLRANIAGAAAIPDILLGDDQEAAQDLGEAARLSQRAELYRPRVSTLDDVQSPGDAAELLVNTLAGQAANIGLTVAGGGVGGVLAKAGLRRAATAAGEAAAARALPLATKLNPATAGAATARVGAMAAERAGAARVARGAALGAAGAAYPQMAGENLLAAAGDIDPNDPAALQQAAAGAALTAVPQTLLETALPMRVLKNLGLVKTAEQAVRRAAPPSLLRRLATEGAKGSLTEGTTELAQQVMQRGLRSFLANNIEMFDDAALSEYLDSFALGAIAGGGFGAGSAGVGAGLQRLLAPRGSVSGRYEEIQAQREREKAGFDGARESQDEFTGDQVEAILGKVLRPDSFLHPQLKEFSKTIADFANSKQRRTPDDVDTLQRLIAGQLRPEFQGENNARAIAELLTTTNFDPDEDVGQQDAGDEDTGTFEEADDPRAVSTVEPSRRKYYGDTSVVDVPEEEGGGKQRRPTPLTEQLFQSVTLSNKVQEMKGSDKRFDEESSSLGKNMNKLRVEQARREGKQSVDEIAARLNTVSGAERVREEARATGRDADELALEVAAKLANTPEKQAVLKAEGAMNFLEHYKSIAIEESPLDTAPGYTTEQLELATVQGNRPQQKGGERTGDLTFIHNGKPRTVDIKKLVFAEHKDSDITPIENEPALNRAARYVSSALTKLVNTPGVEFDPSTIDDDTVVYARKGGGRVTWGQVKKVMPPLTFQLAEGEFTEHAQQETGQGEGIDSGVAPVEAIEERVNQVEKTTKGATVEPLLQQRHEQGTEDTINRQADEITSLDKSIDAIYRRIRENNYETGEGKQTAKQQKDADYAQIGKLKAQRDAAYAALGKTTSDHTRPAEKDLEVSRLATEPRTPTRKPVRLPERQKPDAAVIDKKRFEEFVGQVLGKLPGSITPEGVAHAKTVGKPATVIPDTPFQREVMAQVLRDRYEAYESQDVVEDGPEADTPATKAFVSNLRKYLNELTTRFGLPKIKLVTSQKEMIALYEARLDRAITDPNASQTHIESLMRRLEKLKSGLTKGLQYTDENGNVSIYVNADMAAKNRGFVVQVLGHELGHVIAGYVKASPEQAGAIREAYNKWREARGKEPLTKKDIGRSKKPALMQSLSEEVLQDEDAIAYQLDFEEWFADNVSRWLSSNKEATNAVEKYFKAVAAMIRKITAAMKKTLGLDLSPDEAVRQFLDSMFDASEHIDQAKNYLRASGAIGDERAGGKTLRQWAIDNFAGISATQVSAANTAPASAPANIAVQQVIDNELTDKERAILGRVFTNGATFRALLKWVEDNVGANVARTMQRDPRETVTLAITYGYQAFRTDPTFAAKLGPQTESLFESISALLARWMGTLRRHEKAREILLAAQHGVLAARNHGAAVVFDVDAVRGTARQQLAQKGAKAVAEMAEQMAPMFRPVLTSISRVVRTSPTLAALGNRFATRSGAEGQAQSYVEAKNQRMAEFARKFHDAYGRLTEPQRKELLEILQNPTLSSKDAAVRAARNDVRRVMAEIYSYATHADRGGPDLMDKRGEYFPWVMDLRRMQERREEIVKWFGSPHYADDLAKMTYTEKRPNGEIVSLEMTPERLFDKIMDQYGNMDEREVKGTVPHARHLNVRWLGFLYDKGTAADKKMLSSLFEKNLDVILMTYTGQVVKRAEYAAILGPKGERLDEIYAQARKEGATDADLKLADDFIAAMMGSYGAAEFHPLIKAALKLPDNLFGTKWADMDPKKLRHLQGMMVVYQNLRVLAFATLSSISDVSGLLLRGDLESAYTGFKQGMRAAIAMARGEPDVLTQLGHTVGIIEQHAIQELLQQAYGSAHIPSFARKLNDGWFKAIGLTHWTMITRLMALAAGKQFIKNQIQKPNKHSPRFLSELDLKASDVTFDENGEVVINEKVKAALNRYVDQTIIRPNASQRPLWGSHPDFAVFFHLKQFMFSMHEVILRRMGHEVANGNYSPVIIAMTSYVAIAVLADLVREELKYDEEDPRKNDWTLFDYVDSGARRAGLYGVGEVLTRISEDRKYGGTGAESFLGPTYSHGRELANAVFGGRSLSRTALEAIPGAGLLLENRIYDGEGGDVEGGDGEVEGDEGVM